MPPKLTGPRADLAASITLVARLTADLSALREAGFRLPDGIIDAQDEAAEQLKQAKLREARPAVMLARARGQPVDGATLEAAQAALDAANLAIEQAQQNCRTVAAIVPKAESDLTMALARRDELIASIIREDAGTRALLAEFAALEARMATVRGMLEALPATALPLNVFYIRDIKPDPDAVAAVKAWRQALTTSADAPYPTDPSTLPQRQEVA